ncbi:hypothetical protein YC2023_007605 [Brassica napus]
MMSVDDSLTCSFQIIMSNEKKIRFVFKNVSRPGTPSDKVTIPILLAHGLSLFAI